MPALVLNKPCLVGPTIDLPADPIVVGCPVGLSVPLSQQTRLHCGRHSVVWAGYSAALKQPVVLKVYDKAKMKSRHVLNVYREIAILQQYVQNGHPGVVTLVSHWEDEYTINLMFEQCAGGDLFQLLQKFGPRLPEPYVCCQVVVPLLATLCHLHANAIVHRDIKPENVFISATGQLKLGDFGLAVCLLQDRAVARVGTLDYMAPEVLSMPTPEELAASESLGLEPHGGYGTQVDVWALGVLVYELLVGKPPFEVEDTDATTHLIQAAAVTAFPADLSPLCRDFICQALHRDPAARPTAAELLKHPWVEAQLAAPPSLPTTPSRLRRNSSSGDWLLKAGRAPPPTPTTPYLSPTASPRTSITPSHDAATPTLSPRPSTTLSLDHPPTSPTRRESAGSTCSSPRLAWKQASCNSPMRKSSLGPCKSRFCRSDSLSASQLGP